MTATPLLEVRNLKVHFPIRTGGLLRPQMTPLRAVDGVDFALHPGETLGVVGESGCGKSTLGRAILRLIAPTEGQILWRGDDLAEFDAKQMRLKREELQIVFQDPLASLNPRMTVGEIIAEPLVASQPTLSKTDVQKEVSELLERVGLLPRMARRYPHEFSGGQCQRISIARAMIVKPKLIVLDEPVSALDVSIQAQIINLLKQLQRDFDLSYLFISHDLSVVKHMCDRVVVMYLGRCVETADSEALFTSPKHPYTRALINAVPIPDPRIERAKPHLTISDELPSPLDPPSGCAFRTRCRHAGPQCASTQPGFERVAQGHDVACHHWRDIASQTGPAVSLLQ